MGGLIGLIYMIVTTEQLVKQNSSIQDNLGKWTFGQTLGVIMLVQQLLEIVEYLTTRKWARVNKGCIKGIVHIV